MGKLFISNGKVSLHGELSCFTVPALNKNIKNLIKHEQEITFDLSQVASSDNAGIGLLVSLANYAKSKGKKISFVNVPKQILDLLEAVKVKDILPIGVKS